MKYFVYAPVAAESFSSVCLLGDFIIMDQVNTVVIILASANLRHIPSVISLWPFFFYFGTCV